MPELKAIVTQELGHGMTATMEMTHVVDTIEEATEAGEQDALLTKSYMLGYAGADLES